MIWRIGLNGLDRASIDWDIPIMFGIPDAGMTTDHIPLAISARIKSLTDDQLQLFCYT